MVSCTEFIPLYSELFKYIEDKADHDAVVRYWEHVREAYVEDRLGALAEKLGIAACWAYWGQTLTEEASDVYMEYDEEGKYFISEMRHCPSRGMLNSLEHMEPYHDYCGHCAVLYSPILARYGIMCEEDYSHVDEARCSTKYYIPKEAAK